MTRVGDTEPRRLVENVRVGIGTADIAFFPNIRGSKDGPKDPSLATDETKVNSSETMCTKQVQRAKVEWILTAAMARMTGKSAKMGMPKSLMGLSNLTKRIAYKEYARQRNVEIDTNRWLFLLSTYWEKMTIVESWIKPKLQQAETPVNPTPYNPSPMAAMTGAMVTGEM